MAAYATFTTARTTMPDMVALTLAVRAATGDATAALYRVPPGASGEWRGKKATAWSAADLTAAQAALDTTPSLTAQLGAQRTVDSFPIETRAIVLALIDQLNVIRAALPVPLSAITPAQAIAAIRTKAGTLS